MSFLIILTQLLFSLSCNEAGHADKYFSSFDNTKIRYRVYQGTAQTKKDIIVFVQGRNEFIEKYDHFYKFLNKLGYKVYTFDLRGQGLSEGTRCHIKSYDTYVGDLGEFLKKIPLARGQKINLISHSTGGLIAIIYLQKDNGDQKINKVILSSPFLGVMSRVPTFLLETYLSLMSLIRSIDDRIDSYDVNKDFKENNQTHDEILYDKFNNNKLKCGKPTYGWVMASIKAVGYAFSNMDKIDKSLTILMTDMDTVVDASRTVEFCKMFPNCKIIEFKGMYHELLNEADRDKVFKEIQKNL